MAGGGRERGRGSEGREGEREGEKNEEWKMRGEREREKMWKKSVISVDAKLPPRLMIREMSDNRKK